MARLNLLRCIFSALFALRQIEWRHFSVCTLPNSVCALRLLLNSLFFPPFFASDGEQYGTETKGPDPVDGRPREK